MIKVMRFSQGFMSFEKKKKKTKIKTKSVAKQALSISTYGSYLCIKHCF